MRKNIALWSILALCMMLTAVAPTSTGASKESKYEFGKEYTTGGSGTIHAYWYMGVNPGDNITVTITKNSGSWSAIYFDPTLVYKSSSIDSELDSGIYSFNPAGDRTFWFVCACTQVFYLDFYTTWSLEYSKPWMTFNVTKVNGTDQKAVDIAKLKQDVSALNASLSALNTTVANLTAAFLANLSIVNNYTAYLNASIADLNASTLAHLADLLANFSLQGENITLLLDNVESLWRNLSVLDARGTSDYNDLRAQLAALNASLAETYSVLRVLMEMNDTALKELAVSNQTLLKAAIDASYINLTEQLRRVNVSITNITNVTNNITERVDYNDTALWAEVGRLNATPPVTIVQANNTTVVNTTEVNPTTYVNKTQSLTTDDVSTAAKGAIGGAISGGILGAAAVIVARGGKKEPLPQIPAPEPAGETPMRKATESMEHEDEIDTELDETER